MNKLALRLLLLSALLLLIALGFIYREHIELSDITSQVEQAGAIAPAIFILIYIGSTVLFLPGSILTLLGGAMFGPVLGTLYSLCGATLGAILAFIIARYLASDWVSRKSQGRLKQLISGVENEGWRFVAFTRLVPLFPFNLLNYALGLTRIRLLDYSIATFIFMLPGAAAYTYLGYMGRELATGGEDMIQKILLGLALLACVAFLPRFISQLRRVDMLDVQSLRQQLKDSPDMLLLDVRTEADYHGEQGHIEQSVLIPLEELATSTDSIEHYRDKPVVTICRTDRRSSEAARLLKNLGFRQVQVTRRGMTDWIANGYPVTR